MKNLVSYKIFEMTQSDRIDDVTLMLANLSYTSASLYDSEFGGRYLLYKIEVHDESYDMEEFRNISAQTKAIGYTIVNIKRDNSSKINWRVSLIDNNLLSKLNNNDIIFWKDLKFEPWHMTINPLTGIDMGTKACKLKFGENKNTGYDISIIDGRLADFTSSQIEFSVSFGDHDIITFRNECDAEMMLVKLQLEYYKINI